MTNWSRTLRSSLICLIACSPLAAQEGQSLEEAFLIFLANGMWVDGQWQDPLTLAETNGLQDDNFALAEQEVNSDANENDIAEGDNNE